MTRFVTALLLASDTRRPITDTDGRALKYLGEVMVRFPGETHDLSRSGRPTHRVERLDHIVAWFDKYLQRQNIATYDLQ